MTKEAFEKRAMTGLARLPKLPAKVWDKQGVERFGGDQRKSPFKGSQSVKAGDLGEFFLDSIDDRYGSLKKALAVAPLKTITFKALNGVQAGVRADKVAAKIKGIAETDELEAPTVAHFRGKNYLIDGYHSLTALKLGGVRSVQAFVIALCLLMTSQYLSQAQVERIGPETIRFACSNCGNVRFVRNGQLVFGRIADSANAGSRPVQTAEKSANTRTGVEK